MKKVEFVCIKCGKAYGADAPNFRCTECDEPLEAPEITSGRIRTETGAWGSIFQRYADFFPFDRPFPELDLGEGYTPLIQSSALTQKAGVKSVLIKNEATNPTWSFKDRGTAAALRHAVELGYKRVGTLSSGNMAASVAAFGARAGLDVFILVGESTPLEKINPVAMYGAHVIQVKGDYGDVYAASLSLGKKHGIYFANSDAPFRIEGSKTISYEICEQMNFEVPDYVIVPTSSGGNFRSIEKGFREFLACGFTKKKPILIAAQDIGICPIHRAFSEGRENVEHFDDGIYLDNAIANPFPPSGNRVLEIMRRSGGFSVAISWEDILAAQADLAHEGVFVQPGSAVSFAAARLLRKNGVFGGETTVACIVTGSGLKYASILERHALKVHTVALDALDDLIGDL
jgi:threonine synthase